MGLSPKVQALHSIYEFPDYPSFHRYQFVQSSLEASHELFHRFAKMLPSPMG